MNILIIFNTSNLRSEYEHLCSFGKESKHKIFYVYSYNVIKLNLDIFDGIILHHSIKREDRDFDAISMKLSLYKGFKCFFIQDIHVKTNLLFQMIENVGFNVIFTSIPKDSVEKIFPPQIYKKIKFISTLRGYFDDSYLKYFKIKPIQEREFHIGYKGKSIELFQGSLGYQKISIAETSIEFCKYNKLNFHITKSTTERIYGDKYFHFLNNSKATLGNESGCNMLDLDGDLGSKIFQMKQNNISEKIIMALLERDDLTNHISPRLFESIYFRNLLILFEGNYSGILKPYKHYFPLKKDFSNLTELKIILEDNSEIKKVTDRAFDDIIKSKRYDYKSFIKIFDNVLDENFFKEVSKNNIFEIQLALQSTYISYFTPKIPLENFKYPSEGYAPRSLKITNQINPLSSKNSLPSTLRTVIFYDACSTHVSTTKEHLESFEKYSEGQCFYLPSRSSFYKINDGDEELFDLSIFDVAIVHYTVRLTVDEVLSDVFIRKLNRFKGKKLLFIQDEYEKTNDAIKAMQKINFDIVYTCVPQIFIEKVYPKKKFPKTTFIQTLTGYVPENKNIEKFALPLNQRQYMISYRGRILNPIYGMLGKEKYDIGIDMKAFAIKRGISVNIEVDDLFRIYGDAWYTFLGSARATLGTESGSNIFDTTGELAEKINKLLTTYPSMSFDDIHSSILAEHEGKILMNQVSPKIFEAISLRTALILFEGTYSNVITPDIHFIPLKKDYSNIDVVLNKLNDNDFIEAMTERAFNDIILSNNYSYRTFVNGVYANLNYGELKPRGFLTENSILPTASNVGIKETYFSYYDFDNNLINAFPVLPILDTLNFKHYENYDLTIKTLRAENFSIDLYQRRQELVDINASLARGKKQVNRLVEEINKHKPNQLTIFYIGTIFNKILNKIKKLYKVKNFYIATIFNKILNKIKTFFIGTFIYKILNKIKTFYKVKTFYIATIFNKIFTSSKKNK